jgi:hypothetical protein
MFVAYRQTARAAAIDLRPVYEAGNGVRSGLTTTRMPARDKGGYQRACKHDDEGLVIDLAELANGGEQDGEHENEHAGARRQCTHQLSAGAR